MSYTHAEAYALLCFNSLFPCNEHIVKGSTCTSYDDDLLSSFILATCTCNTLLPLRMRTCKVIGGTGIQLVHSVAKFNIKHIESCADNTPSDSLLTTTGLNDVPQFSQHASRLIADLTTVHVFCVLFCFVFVHILCIPV